MVDRVRRRWASCMVLVLAAFAVIATSQPRWSVKHARGGVVYLPAGQSSARFAVTVDASHTLSLTLRFSPSFADARDSRATIRVSATARGMGLRPQEARMSDTAEAGAFETGSVEFYELVRTQPSHAEFDVVVERVSGEQALSVGWDAEAVTGEKGDSTAPKSAFVRVVESPVPGP